MAWISVRHWRRFQHYDPAKRQPPWIKNYTELTHSDEYLSLKAGERALLHGIWLEYASSQCQLRFSSLSLTRRLNLKVSKRQLQSLIDAGWIDIVASRTLAEGYHDASARAHVVELEEEGEGEKEPKAVTSTEDVDWQPPETNGLEYHQEQPPLDVQELLEQTAAALRSP